MSQGSTNRHVYSNLWEQGGKRSSIAQSSYHRSHWEMGSLVASSVLTLSCAVGRRFSVIPQLSIGNRGRSRPSAR
jgi:hypothetical protein